MIDRHGRHSDEEAAGPDEAVRSTRDDRVQAPRTNPMQFAREVRDELRQVAWPTRPEMVNYTTVVFFTLVLMVGLIFLLNYAFGKGVLFMFQK